MRVQSFAQNSAAKISKTIASQMSLVRFAALSATLFGALSTIAINPASATGSMFGQQEVRQQNFVSVAAPVGTTERRSLLIIEQVSSNRPCWSEQGSEPTVVNPLLLNFDFTGICGRATDSNAYSIRVGGEDLGIRYMVSLVRQGDDLVLQGRPVRGEGPTLEMGRTKFADDFTKITLNPGWRLTKRTYQGRTLGHLYFTNDSSLAELAEATGTIATNPTPNSTPNPTPTSNPVNPNPTPTVNPDSLDWRDRLNLTTAQRTEIDRIHQDYLKQQDQLVQRLEQAQTQLQAQVFSGDRRSARTTRTAIRNLHRDLADLQYNSLNAMYTAMNSQQQVAFNEMLTRRTQANANQPILTGMVR